MYHWDSFLYFFAVGGIFFVIGFILPILRKDIRWSRREDRHSIFWVGAGMFLYVFFYLAWQFYAIGKS